MQELSSCALKMKVRSSTYRWIGVVWVPVVVSPSVPVCWNEEKIQTYLNFESKAQMCVTSFMDDLSKLIWISRRISYMIKAFLTVRLLIVGFGFAVLVVPQVHLIDDLLLGNTALSAQGPAVQMSVWKSRRRRINIKFEKWKFSNGFGQEGRCNRECLRRSK